jgi:hypothetical protein
VPITRGKTAVAETERSIASKPARCLVITSPGWRTLYVSPESEFDEWVRALSSLEAPPNAADLRRSTIGDRPVVSVALDQDADDDVPTPASSTWSGASADGADASSAACPSSCAACDDAQPTPQQCAPAIASGAVNVGSSWPPEEGQSQWSLKDTARAAAAEAATRAAADPDAPAVQRAIAASQRATASVTSAAGDAAESKRDVAAAVLTLQGIDWRARVAKAMAQIGTQAAEFDAQMQHLKKKGALPADVRRVAAEQLLDAIGAIAVAVHGLLAQAEQEVASEGYLASMQGKLSLELRRLPATVAAFRRWGLEVPSELLSVDADELCSIPLAATDPSASGDARATVQRVIGALVVAGGEEALKHVAWVDFDDDGNPVFLQVHTPVFGLNPTVSRPLTTAAPGSVCAHIDSAFKIYDERSTVATGELVPSVLGDVAAYAHAKAAALAEHGADVALSELVELVEQVPQQCGPRGDDDGGERGNCGDASSVLLSGMARAKALARMADPHAPPPTMLAHVVHKQHRAVAGSKWLYEAISKIAELAGVELVVLPGGVKKLPRTVFKCAVNYNCDLSQISDQVRCTVVCESLAQVTAMLRALLASADVSVVRVKNRFAPDYDATLAGGYLDLQTIVAFECGAPGNWMLGEVQVNLWSMLRIKEAPGGGHKVFNFARSLRAYDEATYVYEGNFDAAVAARIAAGALLVVDLKNGGCETEEQDVELGMALASSKCRVAVLDLSQNAIGDSGVSVLAEALKTNTSVTKINLYENEIGDSGAVALAVALKTNTSVTKIDLHENEIGDSGALLLANALKTNTSVTEIDLSGNEIGDSGAVALADALKTNASVTKIALYGNQIGDSGAVALADALKINTSVTEIEFWQNKIGPDGERALAAVNKPDGRVAVCP